ncbi:DUF1993 domain-containing protein [Novosphingobium sp. B 225]|uniref:DUF1993 domain-containing protein n=1 Tax=Novosphingobium sp. B 225 TaxID=1961849 RepID=UPI000B4B390D|nr:DUF1993 domain-containing protein [Novosphingobium sp. B 225]
MSASPYQSSVPAFIAMLTNIKNWLDKAAAQKSEGELIEARLAPDMFPLARQIQIASDAAKGAAARLTGVDAPAMPDTETTFAELRVRCDKTIAFLQSADAAAYDAGLAKEVVITFPNGAGIRFDGHTFLTGFALPNFYFHASMAYAILRANGVDLGKQDFLAHLAPFMFPPPAAE